MSTKSSTIAQYDQMKAQLSPWPMTALILCGGKSTRMGRPKAFLPYQGALMITHVIDLVRRLFAEVLLVTNEPELFDGFEMDIVKDILPYRGPLGGILSGLLIASYDRSFVIPCDMPFISRQLMEDMVSRKRESDVLVLKHENGLEPLVGIYSKNCIKSLEEAVFHGETSLNDFVSGLSAEVVHCFEKRAGYGRNSLPPYFNIDTPQDYATAITQVNS